MASQNLVRSFIVRANMCQLGSFGEGIYQELCMQDKRKISPLHVGRADFLVDGKRIDVKTSRRLINRALRQPVLRTKYRVADTDYVAVEFHISGALVSREGKILKNLNWAELLPLFEKWKSGYYGYAHTPRLKGACKLCPALVGAIKEGFSRAGLKDPYILYRTIMFSNESPANLLPSQRNQRARKGWTVFLVCRAAPADMSNLDYIIAFPDEADALLPRLKIFHTSKHIPNLEKADLSLLPSGFRFNSIEALYSRLAQLSGK